ncbi:MAG: hypothetical protein WBO34_05375 [Gammaproteobacteria bacterium]
MQSLFSLIRLTFLLLLLMPFHPATAVDIRASADPASTAINSKFNQAGIVIAFPQCDLHLDTSRPLAMRVLHDAPGDEQK